jgi:peroxiredoxin
MNNNTHKALRETIRQEVIKALNEGTLTKGLSVKYLSGNKYIMYFSKFNQEPSLADLEKSLAMIYKTLKTKDELIGLIKIMAKPSVFVIDGDVCIGDTFTSKLKAKEMDEAVGLTNDEY